MIPTREQIDTWRMAYNYHQPANTELNNWICTAALEKLDAMPFQPGEVVEFDGIEVKVGIAAGENTDNFSGMVMKSDDAARPEGYYSTLWGKKLFTRKTTNS